MENSIIINLKDIIIQNVIIAVDCRYTTRYEICISSCIEQV